MIKVKLSNWKSDHQMDEAYKALRTNIQFCGADKKVIALTSCTPNEGKSSVAFNLAASLAESGKSVLLIDADLRKSVLMGRVTVDQEVMGLAHYLSKQAKLSDVICATTLPKFHIIFSGIVPPNPAELLGNRLFKDMIRVVRDVYDYVIVDTPPLGLIIDSAIIADSCDGSVIVVESGTISYLLYRNEEITLPIATARSREPARTRWTTARPAITVTMASMVNTASTVSMVPTEIMVRAAVNKKTLTTEMSGLF